VSSFVLSDVVRLSGLPVDTIRYYQSIGLLDGPRRQGRRAIYNEAHLKRLRLIRSMARRGLPLKVIKTLVRRPTKAGADRVLLAAVEEEAGEARYTTTEFAKLLGIPRGLLDLIEGCGLRETLQDQSGAIRYSDADLGAARGVLRMLDYGIPVTRLLGLALKHHDATRETVDRAIDLFNEYIRGKHEDLASADEIADAFREMLPTVASLIAHHFYRLLVGRALSRLKQSGDEEGFRAARQATARRLSLNLALR